ncbi:helix-turn-helix transcriptional regulator [Xinfangfangia pollutisoli]|uniref:helix-turn-helix transcriptional regulator n=1 Tax=Xinfangfangia pollutisoli TaxID=2865960 RepID=UPI001CD4AE75|nr:LuxR family transcriptional regulator [Xinfangfangia pollutisoli]
MADLAVYDMTSEEISGFAEIVGMLSGPITQQDIREHTYPKIMALMRSEFLASYTWHETGRRFEVSHVINQSAECVDSYLKTYQFQDPMTAKLRALWRPAFVDEVITRADLSRTGFYNDFLAKDGMSHGINLFMRQQGREMPDLRLWRGSSRPDYSDREIRLLGAIGPFLARAFNSLPDVTLDCLTERERDISLLVARGCSDKDIARILQIGFATVRTHVGRCFEKLSCSNRSELAALVARLAH